MKLYSKRDFLDLFPERRPSERIPYHVIRDDGVYLREPSEFEARVGLTEIPVEHPTGEPGKPALPFPFTLRQFLEFERTAGLVAEMSDEEVSELKGRNLQSYELARAARDDEALRQWHAMAPFSSLLEGHWEQSLDELPGLARARLRNSFLSELWDALSVAQRRAEAATLDYQPDLDEQRETEDGLRQGYANIARQRGEKIEVQTEAVRGLSAHPLVSCQLPDDRTVYRVKDALDLCARVIHPASADSTLLTDAMRLQITRDEHVKALEHAVRIGAVTILNSTTLTRLPPMSGEALERASIARDEFQRFARLFPRIEFLTPARHSQREQRRAAGRYTLEEAAHEIAQQAGERADEMLGKLMRAAQAGELPVHEPGREGRYRYGEGGASCVREFYEEAYASDLNKWIAKREPRVRFRFPEEPRETAPVANAVPASKRSEVPAEPAPGQEWKVEAQREARAIIERDKARDMYPSQVLVAEEIARSFRKRGVVGSNGKPLSAATIKRHALNGIESGADKRSPTRIRRGK